MWKTIEEFPTYQVNEKGQIRNRLKKHLRAFEGAGCYLRVCLYRPDKTKSNRVIHRLVAQAFLKDWDSKLQVDHIDRNKDNNNLSNLRMATHLENMSNRKFHKDRMADIMFKDQPWIDPWEGVKHD